MRLTLNLARHVTFFSRPGCGLCDQAKRNLSDAWELCRDKFDYEEVNIMKPENQQWYDKYAFDVPVVHIKKHKSDNDDGTRLMHRMQVNELLEALGENQQTQSTNNRH